MTDGRMSQSKYYFSYLATSTFSDSNCPKKGTNLYYDSFNSFELHLRTSWAQARSNLLPLMNMHVSLYQLDHFSKGFSFVKNL